METKFQTSFIPKKPVVEERRGGSSMSLFLLLSIIVFLVSLGLVGWIFMQKNLLINKIKVAQTTIQSNKGQFEEETIKTWIRLDSRMKVATTLLDKHVSVSPVFGFIQGATLKNVRFNTFNFSSNGKNESGAQSIKVSMTGQTVDSESTGFQTISLQAEEFGNINYRKMITNPVVSNLNPNSDGSVSFSVSLNVVPEFLSFSKKIVK